MTEAQKIRNLYQNLVNDVDFERLELELEEPNIFQVLSVARTEIRHSNFLGWLLDPDGNHGLGKMFLRKFLREVASSNVSVELDELDVESLDFSKTEIRREWKNIDLLIIIDSLVICIENKVDSQDHSNQLEKYRGIVNDAFPKLNKVFVYLTPDGSLPKTKGEEDYYAPYSYQSIADQIETILSIHGKTMSSKVEQYISDYLVTIKRELMKNDTLNDIANKIYKNHKDLIDFVYENKSDSASELYPLFVKKIEASGWVVGSKNRGYAKFLTPKLQEIIPHKGKGWPNKENFLFEIDFFWNPGKIIFKAVISPAQEDIQGVLKEALESIPDHKKPRGKKWLVHFQHSWKLDVESFDSQDYESFVKELDKEWHKLEAIVEKVEAALLERADDLKAFI